MRDPYRAAMKEASIIIIAALIFGFVSTGLMGKGFFRTSLPSTVPGASRDARSIFLTYEEALDLYDQKRALFIDARHAYDFGLGHIKGAVNIPLNEFDKLRPILADLPRDKTLVVYCDGEECNSSAELAKLLYGSGYEDVRVYFGGWNQWLAHQQPTDP
jgi:rhodanese-related sulfurtransferase